MPTTPESRIKIQVNNLTKRFGDLTVLDGINFNIKEGELLAIVGPTGCGKTTFLNTLSKLMPATEGEILIDGEEANPKKHNISYVFQEPTCLPWRTVRENVAYGMEVKGVGKEEREARATQIMDLVGLSSCADLYPNQVSASMMQRIIWRSWTRSSRLSNDFEADKLISTIHPFKMGGFPDRRAAHFMSIFISLF